MIKYIYPLVLSLVIIPSLALAANCNAGMPACPGGAFCLPNPLKYDSFECLINAIVSFIFTASLLLAPIMILIGAFILMTAAGDPIKVKRANNVFIYTGVGILIVFMAKGLVSAIRALMGA